MNGTFRINCNIIKKYVNVNFGQINVQLLNKSINFLSKLFTFEQ